jgi:hypothetical protein
MKAEKVDCGTPVFVKGGRRKASSHIKLSNDINLRVFSLQQGTILVDNWYALAYTMAAFPRWLIFCFLTLNRYD